VLPCGCNVDEGVGARSHCEWIQLSRNSKTRAHSYPTSSRPAAAAVRGPERTQVYGPLAHIIAMGRVKNGRKAPISYEGLVTR
jgi:hypothetical protein